MSEEELPESPPERLYVRRAIRGQNLDRAGLSPQHQKILSSLGEPRSLTELAEQMAWETDEVRRVLYGLWLADLVEVQTRIAGPLCRGAGNGHRDGASLARILRPSTVPGISRSCATGCLCSSS